MFTLLAKPIKGQHWRILERRWNQRQISPTPCRKTHGTQMTKQNTGKKKKKHNTGTHLQKARWQPSQMQASGGESPTATRPVCCRSLWKTHGAATGAPQTWAEQADTRPQRKQEGLCLLQQWTRTGTWNSKGLKGLEKSRPQYSRSQPERTPSWDRPTLRGSSKKWKQSWAGQKMDKGIRKVK